MKKGKAAPRGPLLPAARCPGQTRRPRQPPGWKMCIRDSCGISCVEAAASVLTLQRSMLVSFGAMNARERDLMDLLTGAAVCLFILILGVLMMIQGIKKGIVKDGKIKTRTGK